MGKRDRMGAFMVSGWESKGKLSVMRQHSRSFFRTGGIFLAIGIGLLCPSFHTASFLIAPLLMLMLFFVFLRISAPLHTFRGSHLWLLGWNLGVGPLAYGVIRYCGGEEILALAALMAGLSPTGTAAPVVMGFLDGKVEYVILAFLISTLGMTFALPFLLPYFLNADTSGLTLAIFQSLGGIVFIPLFSALTLRKCWPPARQWYRKTQNFTFLLWITTLCLMVANASYFLHQNSTSWVILLEILGVTGLICLSNFGMGYLFGGKEFPHECSQALGQKNTSLTFYIAITYASPAVALGPCMYILWHNLWNALQMALHQENTSERVK